MKIWTIWTLSAMSFKERLRRTRDWAAIKVASRLPKRVRYWTAIQEMAHATQASPNIPATPLDEVLKNLDAPKVVT